MPYSTNKTHSSFQNCQLSSSNRLARRFFSLWMLIAVMLPFTELQTNAYGADLADLFGDSSGSQNEFLPVDKAFNVLAEQSGNKVTVTIDITPGHYVYQNKLKLNLPDGVTATPFRFNQTAKTVDDPNFGKVPIFDQSQVIATATLTNSSDKAIQNSATLNWQGCAKAGLCYQPERQKISINLPKKAVVGQSSAGSGSNKANAETKSSSKTEANKKETASTQSNSANTKQSESKSGVNQKADSQNTAPAIDANGSDELQTNSAAQTNEALQDEPQDELQGDNAEAIINANDLGNMAEGSEGQTQGVPDDINLTTNEALEVETETEDFNSNIDNNVNASYAQSSNVNLATDSQMLNTDSVNNADPFGLATHPLLALGLIFLAGLVLAFTPCVLPMLPIVSNIVARQHNPTVRGGVILSGAYALGVATAYGILGALIAIFGQSLNVIGWLQNPVILLTFAGVFAVLALYMLEVINLRLPTALSQKLQATSQKGDKYLGSVWGSGLAGLLSALVVSPCVSAPLFGVLIAVSTIGNPVLGFFALFLLGLGLSAPLILVGASEGGLMPKAGEWMNWVKQGFALLLFAVSLLLIERVLMSAWMLLLWAVWFMVVAMWAWGWQGKGQMLSRAIASIAGVWAVCLLVGVATGSNDSWQPLNKLTLNGQGANAITLDDSNQNSVMPEALQATTITTIAELEPIIAQNPKVFVDVTADWCIECRIMDKTLFANPPAELAGWKVVKLDITETNADSKQVMQTFKLFGPPTFLYFVNGELQGQQVGEVKRQEFIKVLTSL